jgi:N-acetylglucosamine kinase-like BadF-type ATPase
MHVWYDANGLTGGLELRVFSGIEGGATRTVCVVGDETGRLFAARYGAAANYLTVGIAEMTRSIANSLKKALDAAELRRPPEAVYAGLAGVGLLSPRRAVDRAVKKATRAKKVFVNSDGYVALYGSFLRRPGMILVSGTGSVAMGFDEKGRLARVGGWGHILGDEGSAFHLGLEGIRAVVRAHDGSLPMTSLTERALSFLRIRHADELVKAFYMEDVRKDRLAKFSKDVVDAATQGDEVATGIVNSEIMALKSTVTVLRKKLSLSNPKLVLCGGVFEGSQWFKGKFVEALGNEVEVVEPQYRPVTGAFMLALDLCGIELTPEVLRNISRSERVLTQMKARRLL